MLKKIKYFFMFAVSFLYIGIFYEINYHIIKSLMYLIKGRI